VRIATGKVVSGKVIIEGEPLEDGTTVTILARDSDETFELSPDDEAKLLASIAEAEQGETVSAISLVRDLDTR
jgi:hypothetical protein